VKTFGPSGDDQSTLDRYIAELPSTDLGVYEITRLDCVQHRRPSVLGFVPLLFARGSTTRPRWYMLGFAVHFKFISSLYNVPTVISEIFSRISGRLCRLCTRCYPTFGTAV